MTFKLHIELGNDAMQSPDDVADALKTVARRIENHGFDDADNQIRDINGNSVGRWDLERP